MCELQRRPISLRSLLVAIGVLFLVSTVGSAQILSLIQQYREAKRRDECANHLKQLALAVHSYHDTYNQLPPLATDEDYWTWVALTLPYLGQQKAFDGLDLLRPAKDEDNRKAISAVRMPVLVCPTRRSSGATHLGDFAGGPVSDYVAVSTTDLKKLSDKTSGMIIYRAARPTREKRVRSATTFASVKDGLSNTAMIGEKHMHPIWLFDKYDEPALVAFNDPNTIRLASDVERDKEDGETKRVARGLATLATPLDEDGWKFGSWHPTICQFALGDGSVRAVSNKSSPAVLRLLCGRNDGKLIEFAEDGEVREPAKKASSEDDRKTQSPTPPKGA